MCLAHAWGDVVIHHSRALLPIPTSFWPQRSLPWNIQSSGFLLLLSLFSPPSPESSYLNFKTQTSHNCLFGKAFLDFTLQQEHTSSGHPLGILFLFFSQQLPCYVIICLSVSHPTHLTPISFLKVGLDVIHPYILSVSGTQ